MSKNTSNTSVASRVRTASGQTVLAGASDSRVSAALVDNPDFLKDILTSVLQRFLDHEMEEHIGAERYERSEERSTMRNGYKPRKLYTRVGMLTLRVPQARDGSFSTELFNRYQRSEKALVAALMEMYINGVSTRKISRITEELCGTNFSASTVSRLNTSLDKDLKTWANRPLDPQGYPYLFTDATWVNINEGTLVTSFPLIITTGIRKKDGKREILDIRTGQTENLETYKQVFADLKNRGLTGVRLVTSDDHQGITQAIAIHFPGAGWQRCHTHYQRNVLDKARTHQRKDITNDIRSIWASPTFESARTQADTIIEKWENTNPRLALWLEETIGQTLNYYNFPPEHRTRIRTNNSLERLNGEIKRRTRVIRIFPNHQSALRLTTALALEISNTWLTGKTYLTMNYLTEWETKHPTNQATLPTTTPHLLLN